MSASDGMNGSGDRGSAGNSKRFDISTVTSADIWHDADRDDSSADEQIVGDPEVVSEPPAGRFDDGAS